MFSQAGLCKYFSGLRTDESFLLLFSNECFAKKKLIGRDFLKRATLLSKYLSAGWSLSTPLADKEDDFLAVRVIMQHDRDVLALGAPDALVEAFESSSAIASCIASCFLLSCGEALLGGRTFAYYQTSRCDFYYDEPLDWFLHPWQFSLGGDQTRYFFGAAVFNPCIGILFLFVHLAVVHFYWERSRGTPKSFRVCMAERKFPSLSYVVLSYLAHNSMWAAVVVVMHGSSPAAIAICSVLLVMWVAVAGGWTLLVTYYFAAMYRTPSTANTTWSLIQPPRQAETDTSPNPRPPGSLQELEEYGSSERPQESMPTPAAHLLPNRDCESSDDDTFCAKGVMEGFGKWEDDEMFAKRKYRRRRLTAADIDRAIHGRDRAKHEGTFVPHHGSLFLIYREGRHWFVLIELGVTVAVSVISAIRPNPGGCEGHLHSFYVH